MSDKNLYINDLLARNSGYSFTESTTNSIITVTFKDGSSVTQAEATGLTLIDAYRKIRLDVLNGEIPAFLSTTTQRDALTNVDRSTIIDNITTGYLERYNGTSWGNIAGTGIMSPAAYGNMYENNSAGSAMESTNKTWITATAGIVDANSLITIVKDATNGDYFLVGTDGAGDYAVIIDTKQTNAGNNDTTLTVQIDGVDTLVTKDEQDSSSTKPTSLDATGILSLVATNKLRVHMVSATPADIVKSYHTHFYIHRLS